MPLPKQQTNKSITNTKPIDYDLSYDSVIDKLYTIENPKRIGVKDNKVKAYYDGYALTIGPGVAITSGAPKEWFDGRYVDKKLVDDFAHKHFMHGVDVIKKAYNIEYGTKEYSTPADTISAGPLFYSAQTRYQMGNINRQRTNILNAIKEGNAINIQKSVNNNAPKGDIDRKRRLEEAWPLNKLYQNNNNEIKVNIDNKYIPRFLRQHIKGK